MTGQTTALSVLDQLAQRVLDITYELYLLEKNPLVIQAKRLGELDDPDSPEIQAVIDNGQMSEMVKLVLTHMKRDSELGQAVREYCGSREIYSLTVGEGSRL